MNFLLIFLFLLVDGLIDSCTLNMKKAFDLNRSLNWQSYDKYKKSLSSSVYSNKCTVSVSIIYALCDLWSVIYFNYKWFTYMPRVFYLIITLIWNLTDSLINIFSLETPTEPTNASNAFTADRWLVTNSTEKKNHKIFDQ